MKINLDSFEELFTRKQLLWVGILSLLSGIVFCLLAYFFIVNTIQSITSTKEKGVDHVSQGTCINSLRGIEELSVRSKGNDNIVLSSKGLDNATLKLGKASVASLVCPGWELKDFCLGESCENGEGLFFELQKID